MTIPYIVTKDSVTVMYNGVTHTVREGMVNYAGLREAIRNKDWDSVPNLLNPAKAVESFGDGNIEVRDGEVYYQGEILRNGVTRRILDMVAEGFDAEPITLFLANLMANPSKTAVDELYDWLEGTSLPITEDGYFLAYKRVRDDYGSFYDDGKTLNRVGDKPSMPRNKVDDNRNRTCSQGLHFCSLSYLPYYYGGQGRVVIVKVNPADVVSIPSDYDHAKGRAWTYEVIGEHEDGERKEALHTPVVSAKGEPLKGRQFLTEATKTLVLGVNFGTEDRANMVRELINRCGNMAGEDRTVQQARVDGFDDAWNKDDVNLRRYTGNNMRDAVEYARVYFEGYDKCNGYGPQVQSQDYSDSNVDEFDWDTEFEREAIHKVLTAPLPAFTSRHGYDNGYDDGMGDAAEDTRLGRPFDVEAAAEGGKSYRQGYITGYLDSYIN
jgi:hypothetical protein